MEVFWASLLLLFGVSQAQWVSQPRATQARGPLSGSEGPCGPNMQHPSMQGRTRLVRQIPNRADLLGVPPGMSVRQAAVLELDVNNAYDLDLPEAGALQPGMNDVATGRRPMNPGFAPHFNPSQGMNRIPTAVNQGRQTPNQPQTRQIPTQIRSQQFQPAFVPPTSNPLVPVSRGFDPLYSIPYFPRWNCQCDSNGDCNMASRSRGYRYDNQCMFGYVCCCRMG